MLISTYVCHPSLANDNLSGIAVAAMLAKELSARRLRHTYRIVFAPGTIGPLAWLHENRDGSTGSATGSRSRASATTANLTYKRSRHEDADVDRGDRDRAARLGQAAPRARVGAMGR